MLRPVPRGWQSGETSHQGLQPIQPGEERRDLADDDGDEQKR